MDIASFASMIRNIRLFLYEGLHCALLWYNDPRVDIVIYNLDYSMNKVLITLGNLNRNIPHPRSIVIVAIIRFLMSWRRVSPPFRVFRRHSLEF